ncbi:MAG: hypothetical protein A2504_03325 [Bdellovibrionales bacterium RIFOXYD12_FULL_39_22]|nr:MAG: hypothetical protein A2385_15735 [Bdellovibrionales bacterium RIFOXYB1_FULL_39_21]OFZ41556.1 MAG: hypothetical protein A2485_02425 [Bdellovibrionales bacterium RIFOXYC12_FULL_39_17]OFZ45869.1 MAG: hypothetical protein A2404_12790 [Bdellovibrionales bacterium RIFOXYC1_FULL_39_130]OFZ74801.1 MAG: hypothetical protein A2560_10220 [Bdellovibrionales bacterium RIFOXYD1_FULL_39_84]OFZ92661.1 MAG: hypothetical protein A2504_03325 [Bdellovibrionales bacterium RIFOXYD12_FULL_39_22]HLE11290.1 NA
MDNSKIFFPLRLGKTTLQNRVIRAATYEGGGDHNGIPTKHLHNMYEDLARNDVALIITGFNYVSLEGRAYQPRQCGIDHENKIAPWQEITDLVHQHRAKICMQISHCGRQTRSEITHSPIYAPSAITCTYFRQRPKTLSEEKILSIIAEYVDAAKRAQQAGFDGVQVHCAHGYLIHQFFSSHTNRRTDSWGGSYENRFRFAKEILTKIREVCGPNFLILTKISAGDDRGLTVDMARIFCELIDQLKVVDGIEISYGTMEFAMNIFRGKLPINLVFKYNPLFARYPRLVQKLWLKFIFPWYKKKFYPFSENYNLENALAIAKKVNTPIIVTGGIRKKSSISNILNTNIAAVSICRPFLAEPDLMKKIAANEEYHFRCTNCNICTVMCDSDNPGHCYTIKSK